MAINLNVTRANNTEYDAQLLLGVKGDTGKSAYQYAVDGGYEGSETDFLNEMARLTTSADEAAASAEAAQDALDEFVSVTATAETLPAGSDATASYSEGELTLGIPKGDKGDTGDTYDDSAIVARMDSFTQLAEGSTTGDAELIDGRVGADGVTYNNIGGAIRAQVTDLKSDLTNLNNAVFDSLRTARGEFVGGWTKVKLIQNVDMKIGKEYTFAIDLDEAPTVSSYLFVLSDTDAEFMNVNLTNKTHAEIVVTPTTTEYSGYSLAISSGSFTGTCNVYIITNDANTVEYALDLVKGEDDGFRIFDGAFVYGNNYGSFNQSEKYKIINVKPFIFDYDVLVKVGTGYQATVCYYREDGTYIDWSGWKQSGELIEVKAGSRFRVNMASLNTSDVLDIDYAKKVGATYTTKTEMRFRKDEDKIEQIKTRLLKDNLIYHIGVDDAPPWIIVPSQTIADARKAKKLGFSAIELNVRVTSDGKFYCFHGTNGAFGNKFISLDDTDISSVQVNTVTSDYIDEYVRWNTRYNNYKTAPFRLETMLYECKRLGLVPAVEYQAGVIEVLDKIMGKHNYVIGSYSNSRETIGSDAIMVSWLVGTKEQLLGYAKASGNPYIVGVNTTNSYYSSYTDSDWKELTDYLHANGFYTMFAYGNPVYVDRMLKNGFDFCSTTSLIPRIESPNVAEVHSDVLFAEFTHSGTVTDGVLTLANGDTVSPSTSIGHTHLGGAELHITFSGTVNIQLAGRNYNGITSDGKEDVYISTYVELGTPNLAVTAVGAVDIMNIDFYASQY